MTRRSGRARVTERQAATPGKHGGGAPERYPSLRQRNPVAFWAAIIGALAVVASTFATALSAFL